MLTVTIIGPGRVGGALALALPRDKYSIERFVGRDGGRLPSILNISFQDAPFVEIANAGNVTSDIILITVPDSSIAEVAGRISSIIDRPAVVLHSSGALTSEVLAPLRAAGSSIGSVHPLVSISSPELGAERMSGAYFCIEGDESAVAAATSIVSAVGGIPFTIDTANKPLYHASAVMACGHFVALFDIAAELMTKAAGDRERAVSILLPLVESTLANLRQQQASEALTGTFARTDVVTFGSHLEALRRFGNRNVVDIYLDLGLRSLELALESGADPEKAGEIRRQILLAKQMSE